MSGCSRKDIYLGLSKLGSRIHWLISTICASILRCLRVSHMGRAHRWPTIGRACMSMGGLDGLHWLTGLGIRWLIGLWKVLDGRLLVCRLRLGRSWVWHTMLVGDRHVGRSRRTRHDLTVSGAGRFIDAIDSV